MLSRAPQEALAAAGRAEPKNVAPNRTARLFRPPLSPVEVTADRSVVIGRSSECGFAIPADDVSRQHSEVFFSGDGFSVRDLGSTNGTYVNGQKIEGDRRLASGDRIELGSNEVTFCEVGGELERLAPTATEGGATVIFQRPAAAEAIQGDLTEIPLFALLQMLELGSKTGLLTIDSPGGLGRVWLGNGHPVHAESPKQSGLDAALELVAITSGSFRFQADAEPDRRSIDVSMTEVLLEGSRIADESGA